MKAIRELRLLTSSPRFFAAPRTINSFILKSNSPCRFFSAAQTKGDSSDPEEDGVFDSEQYRMPFDVDNVGKPRQPTWDEKYRDKVDRTLFGKAVSVGSVDEEEDDEDERVRAEELAHMLIGAGLGKADAEEEEGMLVKEEDQKSLSVGIIGAPNAGKSALTNYLVGSKVAAVSRKTNTTTHEVLGVMTKDDTQICFFDTPGLTFRNIGTPWPHKSDIDARADSAWGSVHLYDVLMVIFDVERHLYRPDGRVIKLIKHVGAEEHPKQKRILCMNKIDLIENRKDLLKVAKEFGNLPGYERHFMISGLKGFGVKDLNHFLMEQAVKRLWDEDSTTMDEDTMKNISLEVVREKMLDHIHQEIPYVLEHRLTQWQELRDGSLRITQEFRTRKQSQRKILVGKNGSKIGRIGMEANEELRSIFQRNVHLLLQVKVVS